LRHKLKLVVWTCVISSMVVVIFLSTRISHTTTPLVPPHSHQILYKRTWTESYGFGRWAEMGIASTTQWDFKSTDVYGIARPMLQLCARWCTDSYRVTPGCSHHSILQPRSSHLIRISLTTPTQWDVCWKQTWRSALSQQSSR
jgi:hypothetical protein